MKAATAKYKEMKMIKYGKSAITFLKVLTYE